jgi:hypothetical protein
LASTPTPRPRSPEDRWPRPGGFDKVKEPDAVRYELAVRLDPRSWHFNPRQTLVIRILREVDQFGMEVIVVAPKKAR